MKEQLIDLRIQLEQSNNFPDLVSQYHHSMSLFKDYCIKINIYENEPTNFQNKISKNRAGNQLQKVGVLINEDNSFDVNTFDNDCKYESALNNFSKQLKLLLEAKKLVEKHEADNTLDRSAAT